MELPGRFLDKMKEILGEEYEAFLRSFDQPRRCGLRVNTAKLTPGEFERIAPFPVIPVPWVENGYYYQAEDTPSAHPYYYAGLYYIQEPSAMTPASRLTVNPGERVLDLCAAPGGKATELGARLLGQGLLTANDISASRVKALLKNTEVSGIPNAFLTNEIPARLTEAFGEYFDKILVDAPCSGEGMFRKNPDAARKWDEKKPVECAKMQREILRQAVAMLRPGGLLMYSTCTFSPEENEQIAAWALSEYPNLHLRDMEWYEGFDHGRPYLADGNPELTRCIRIWPHRMDGEGHFAALFQKDGESLQRTGKEHRPAKLCTGRREALYTKEEKQILGEFLQKVKVPFAWERIQVRNGQVYYAPEGLGERKGITFVRSGLYMGEIRRKRFEPSQAFAMALTKDDYVYIQDFRADDIRVIKYLKGETVEADETAGHLKGEWLLVCVDGFPLGWAKLVNGILKNKYLAGWRMNG